jgi:hypothetical protein
MHVEMGRGYDLRRVGVSVVVVVESPVYETVSDLLVVAVLLLLLYDLNMHLA